MTKLNSYRITSQSNEAAYAYPISEYMYAVLWEGEDIVHTIPTQQLNIILKHSKTVEIVYLAGNQSAKVDAGILQFKIELEGLQEVQESLAKLGDAVNGYVLTKIKSFTSGTGHDVFISEGIYKVYRKDEDMPYVCHTDEQVVAVMDALITLDEAGKEGEGRFFTLNLEGIL